MKKNKRINSTNQDRMSLLERIIASSGSMTMCIDLMMVQTFLLYYYTDVMKISAAKVGVILLVVRVISAILAPVFGILLDRITTPWGKYRPYYVLMGIPSALFGFLTFTAFDMGMTGQSIYLVITYLFYSLFSSVGSIAKGAMGPMMTKNIQDRISMGLLGYTFAVVGSVITISGAPILVRVFGGGNEAKGYSMTMAVFALLAITISLLQVTVLKEKYPSAHRIHLPKHSIRQMFVAAFHNRTAIIVLLLTLSISLSTGLRSAVTLHYLKYFFKMPNMMSQVGLLTLVGLFMGAFLSPIVTRKIGIKTNLVISTIITILTSSLIYIIPAQEKGIYVYIMLLFISSFFNGLSTPAQSTLMPNAIDYTEWKTGMNLGAFMSSVSSFVSISATAFSGVIVGIILTTSGYQPDVEQSKAALTGIKLLMSVLPAIAGVLSLAIIWLGETEKQHEMVTKALMERRLELKSKNVS